MSVKTRPAPAGCVRHYRRWSRVRSVEIDKVVMENRAKMSVSAHARRLGIGRWTLAEKLRAAGVLGEKRGGVEVRLLPSIVDAALGRRAA